MDYSLIENKVEPSDNRLINKDTYKEIQLYLKKIFETYSDQYQGWRSMNIFEKQWVLRDFKKSMSLSAEQAYDKLKLINSTVQQGEFQILSSEKIFFHQLKKYWNHQLKLLNGYEKNKVKLEKNTEIIKGWILDIEKILMFYFKY